MFFQVIQVLLHPLFGSVSIEEQFYLIWPILLKIINVKNMVKNVRTIADFISWNSNMFGICWP